MFGKIVLPVDASPHSERAAVAAIEMSKKFGGEIVVLHVNEKVMGRGGGYTTENEGDARTLVDAVTKTIKDEGLSARGEVQSAFYGHTAQRIVDLARSEGADLIVMGSRGVSDIAGIFVGSVTHKVLQLTELPVLVVR